MKHPRDGDTVDTVCRVCSVEFPYELTGSVIEEWSGGRLLSSVCHDCIDAEVREEQRRNATTTPD